MVSSSCSSCSLANTYSQSGNKANKSQGKTACTVGNPTTIMATTVMEPIATAPNVNGSIDMIGGNGMLKQRRHNGHLKNIVKRNPQQQDRRTKAPQESNKHWAHSSIVPAWNWAWERSQSIMALKTYPCSNNTMRHLKYQQVPIRQCHTRRRLANSVGPTAGNNSATCNRCEKRDDQIPFIQAHSPGDQPLGVTRVQLITDGNHSTAAMIANTATPMDILDYVDRKWGTGKDSYICNGWKPLNPT